MDCPNDSIPEIPEGRLRNSRLRSIDPACPIRYRIAAHMIPRPPPNHRDTESRQPSSRPAYSSLPDRMLGLHPRRYDHAAVVYDGGPGRRVHSRLNGHTALAVQERVVSSAAAPGAMIALSCLNDGE